MSTDPFPDVGVDMALIGSAILAGRKRPRKFSSVRVDSPGGPYDGSKGVVLRNHIDGTTTIQTLDGERQRLATDTLREDERS